MAKNKVRPKLTSAQIDAKYIAMGEEMIRGSTDKAEAEALAEENAGKFGRPFEYSGAKILHLASLRVYVGAGLRRVEGMARGIYGEKNAPDHTTLCRRINSLQPDILPGAVVLYNYGRSLGMTIDSSGIGMTDTNGWRKEKHGGKRGYLALHTVSDEKTGKTIASKLTAPEEGDAPQFEGLVEDALAKRGIDPEARKEEVRRIREELAAGKAVILARNDGIADTGPEEAERLAMSVEMMFAEPERGEPDGSDGAPNGGADGADRGSKGGSAGGRNARGAAGGATGGGCGTSDDGNGTAKSAAMMSVMARRYAADMEEAAAPILAAAATLHTAAPAASKCDSAQEGQGNGKGKGKGKGNGNGKGNGQGNGQQPAGQEDPGHRNRPEPPSPVAASEEDAAHKRSLTASSALAITECALDALGMDPGADDFADDWIRIIMRGDTAYDSRKIFRECYELAINPCIRIRLNASLRSRGKGDARARAVIDQLGGGNPDPKAFYALTKEARYMFQRAWKVIAHYGYRWLHEASFGSFKALMGGSIMAVKPRNMVTEMALKIGLHNRLQEVGAKAAAST